jgi:acetyltransferase-like isoleucine patch superfamily enzyme
MKIWKFFQRVDIYYHTLIARMAIKSMAKSARVNRLAGIFGGENITLKSNVLIWDYTWLAALSPNKSGVELIIGEGTTIGRFNHIYATKKVEIGKNVLTADKVYISDSSHEYQNINIPVKNQPIKQMEAVYIGDGSWIGENVCIMGAKIGKNCVIGANSIVSKDIPDYSVAVGIPAKVIKQYNPQSDEWESIKNS